MSIWKKDMSLPALNAIRPKTMLEHLGIEITAITDDSIIARMPVDHRTHQPYGIMHGGASAALAETLGSVAAECAVESDKVVGTELHIHHLRQVSSGWVAGVVTAVRIGRRLQVWDIRITDDNGNLVSVARLSTMVI